MADDPIRGKTIRWRYDDGPTKGQEFEHVFGSDGTVTWRMLGQAPSGDGKPREQPAYEVAKAGDESWAVSYLAPSGWTLTTVLDLRAKRIVSFASNEKQLFVQRGTFEVMAPASRA